MAEAAIEERQLLKSLRWYDGLVISLANPGFLLGSLGFSVTDLGGWGAMALWGISALIAVSVNFIYSETAAMFPEKPGGIALYAHEGWRKYTTLVGPIATFGYWIGWSVVLSFLGIFIGQIAQGAWFPGEPIGSPFGEGYFSTGGADIGLPHLIAIGCIVAVWLFNVFNVRIGVTFGYAAGALLMIPLFAFIVLPYITGDWSSSNFSTPVLDAAGNPTGQTIDGWKLNDGGLPWGGWQLALVWLWIMGWSAYGVEVCATFAPEYKNTQKDTAWALRSAGMFSLLVYIFLPLGAVGAVGEGPITSYDYAGALNTLVGGGAGDLMVVLLIMSFIISMNTATADGGRALYGIARDDMTIKQLYHLNSHHIPGRAMTLDMVVNILFVLFIGNIFGILAASNIGYVACHVFALSGFLLLRKDRPNWPRPIKMGVVWLPIAGLLCLANLTFVVVGTGWFQNSTGGYGGTKEKIIGLGILAVSLLLFFYRRIIQDRQPPHWREETPTMPPGRVEVGTAPVSAR